MNDARYVLPIVVRKPTAHLVVSLFGATIATSIGIPVLLEGNASWFAWTGVVICGLAALYYWGDLGIPKPRLIICRDGINVDHWNSPMMPWTDFSGAEAKVIGHDTYLCLTLRDPEIFRHNIGSVRRSIHAATRAKGLGDLMVNLSAFPLDAAVVVAVVEQQINMAINNPRSASSVRYPHID